VHSEEPDANNKYNQNFRNRFCGCECDYDPFEQKGTMFQCLGLGTAETGGCGEDWYHPGCLVGMGPRWFEKMKTPKKALASQGNGALQSIAEDKEATPVKNELADQIPAAAGESAVADDDEDDEPPMPPGFPDEEDFDGLICYKCVESNPWIKAYAGTSCFLSPLKLNQNQPATEKLDQGASKKRKAEDDAESEGDAKRVKGDGAPSQQAAGSEEESESVPVESDAKAPEAVSGEERPADCKLTRLAQRASPVPDEPFSLFFKEGFRDQFCRCSACYLKLDAHPQLLEEEEVYEPPLSDDGASQHGGSTHGSGSLLERGESALRNVDRVRAIEGVMAYNHLKDKLKPFFQQFAESGQAIGAEDIKAYFAKLRGDEEGIKQAGEAAAQDGGDGSRPEQSGY
jgi:E3 ubiquitin-protein ligase UBR7